MKEFTSVIVVFDRCNSQKYTYTRNYTPGIFLRTKFSQKHTPGMFSRQAIRNGQYVRYALYYVINTAVKSVK